LQEVLDRYDLALLRALQDDGRLTNQQLSDQVNLSPSQCSRRRARLETSGHIRGVHAELDASRLGFGVLVFISVTLSRQNPNTGLRFQEEVTRLVEVQEAHAVAGEVDYILKVRVANLAGLADFINRLVIDESVAQLRSTIVLKEIKTRSGLPI
jgi:DNA-binding Lrp family transcriptional regulator